MNIKPLKETTFLEAVAAAIQHEKDYFEFYMNTYEKLPPGDTKELFERLAEEVDDHIKFITELYEQAEGSELPNLKQLTAIHKFHDSTLQKLMNKVERTIAGPGSKDAHEALELAIREAENSVSFYEKLANKFEDVNIKSLFTKLKDYSQNYQSLLETELNGLDQSGSGQGTFFWDEQAEEVAKAESKSEKTPTSKKPKAVAKPAASTPVAKTSTTKTVTSPKPATTAKSAVTTSAKKATPKKKAASKSAVKKAAPKKKVTTKKALTKPRKAVKKSAAKKVSPKKSTPKKKSAAKAKKKR
ncbi:ferritin-like domain-containing protein [Leptospira borgpetersenii]|uniref:ferritin-like domain-containing protein n=1 Tax=Leptospira borgpetersenii TaxID=174 RepID=UPI0007730631|nr:ferritin family protein [Leptospira borgpetersenii]MBE8365251.1 ferritin family protein [Leptospira borgpetersenii serovar Balcanica]MBE8366929.1 ferritin family protein [Leptospira borgpetersenii serovar Balcanica]MBE8424373.1 ferritin family protein [Leptospira borgpetersenii serovar Balcanica]MBF3351451.1 ferritin family protein [Leptospira borgpetersenii serovar Balcanica]MBF3376086.1 ferritin family protein [Leptospira borgpetersenii serovar Balcanica]